MNVRKGGSTSFCPKGDHELRNEVEPPHDLALANALN